MTEVEQGAPALLGLVFGDHAGLDGAAPPHRFLADGGIAGDHGCAVPLAPVEERRVGDQAVFDDLGVAGNDLPVRQCGQRVDVGEHQAGLVEGADHVFGVTAVDRRLAADGTVHLGEQRCRNLDVIDAAERGRRGETGEIADDAAAERDQRRLAVDPPVEQLLHDVLEPGEGLGFLAGRNRNGGRADALGFETVREPGEIEGADVFVGDDDRPRPAEQRFHQAAGAEQQALADDDVIAAPAEIQSQRIRFNHRVGHGAP